MRNLVEEIIKEENISLSVAAGSVAVPTAVNFFSFEVPPKAIFYITHFSNYMNTLAAWGLVTWSFRRNGVGIYPFDSLKDEYGIAAEPRPIAPIEIIGGDKFEIVIINTFPAGVTVGVGFRYKTGRVKE